jgi:hypothetical protein
MKTLKFTLPIIVIAIFICINKLDGQTFQVYPIVTVTNGEAWCLNRSISGSITYHLTYHIDKKTGFVDRMHANVYKAELFDDETGEKYLYIDTGNDNLGVSWGFWNNPDNGGFDYDLPENSIPLGTLPTEGCNVWATFKLMTRGGEKYTMRGVTHVTLNAKGETTAEFNKTYEDCNW